MTSVGSSAGKKKLNWEKFEEQAKLAFVTDPHNSRFFLKTHVTKPGTNTEKKTKKKNHRSNVDVVARVVHQPPQSGREMVQFQMTDTMKLPRVMRLLRFSMQEVLGPMVTATGTSSGNAVTTMADSAGTEPPMSPTAKSSKSKKKKAKKGGKKQ